MAVLPVIEQPNFELHKRIIKKKPVAFLLAIEENQQAHVQAGLTLVPPSYLNRIFQCS